MHPSSMHSHLRPLPNIQEGNISANFFVPLGPPFPLFYYINLMKRMRRSKNVICTSHQLLGLIDAVLPFDLSRLYSPLTKSARSLLRYRERYMHLWRERERDKYPTMLNSLPPTNQPDGFQIRCCAIFVPPC